MVTIELTHRHVVVHVRGWARIHALRSTVTIPLTHVISVRVRPPEADFDAAIVETWRGVGTYTPGKLAAGLVYLADGPAFYDVRNPARAIALDLVHERFCHLVVELEDEAPDKAAARIERAMEARSPTSGQRRVAQPPQ